MFGTATFRVDMDDEKNKLEELIARNDIVILDVIHCSEYKQNVAYVTYKRKIIE